MNEAYIEAKSINKNFYFLFSLMEYDDIPIVFVVRDQEDNIYLCDCTEFRDYQKWIISKTDILTLMDIVNRNKTVYDALNKSPEESIIVVYDYENDTFDTALKKFDDIAFDELPEKGAMLRYVSDGAREKIIMINMNTYSRDVPDIQPSLTKSEKPYMKKKWKDM